MGFWKNLNRVGKVVEKDGKGQRREENKIKKNFYIF